MAEIFDIFFELKANASQAIASFGTVNKELAKMEKNGDIASAGMLKVEKASKFAGIALLGIGGAFATVAGVSIKAAIEIQGAQAKLATAVKDTGISFTAFTPYMNDAVDSMAKLNFTAGDTMTALAQMTAATRNPQVAINLLGTTADLAAFQHETLAQAADTVSRAAMGQAKGLSTLGIALNKTIPKGASVAEIMQAIEDRTKGAAAAAAKADPWKQLQIQFGLMEEKLGTALLPAFQKLSTWIIGTGIPALEKIGTWISHNKGIFETLAATLGLLWVAPKIDALIATIASIATAWGGVATAAEAATIAEDEAKAAGDIPSVPGVFSNATNMFTKSIPLAIATGAAGTAFGKGAIVIGKDTGLTKTSTGRDVVHAGGTAAGAGTGALTGAWIGSIFPGLGTAVGAVVGTIAGGLMGFMNSNPGKSAITSAIQGPLKKKSNIDTGFDMAKYEAQIAALSAKKKKPKKVKPPKGANARTGLMTSPGDVVTVVVKNGKNTTIDQITHSTSKAK